MATLLDVNDRALRNIVIGMSGAKEDGLFRQTGFDITAALEVMAILALATSQRDRLIRPGRIVVGYTTPASRSPPSSSGRPDRWP